MINISLYAKLFNRIKAIIKEVTHLPNKTAQTIAQTASEIIGYDVYITDERGIINGSSDKTKIGSVHAPSVDAINSGKIRHTSSDLKTGESAYCSAPIIVYDRIIGSVSVAGDYRDVTKYMQLVQRHAEVLFKEQTFIESEISRKRAKRDLVKNIANFDRKKDNFQFIRIQASELNWNINKAKFVLALEMRRWTGSADKAFTILTDDLRAIFDSPTHFTCTHGNYSITLFYTPESPNDDIETISENLRDKTQDFIFDMHQKGIEVKVTIGLPAKEPEDLGESLRTARDMLNISCDFGDACVILASEHTAKMLLSLLPQEKAVEYSGRILERLIDRNDFEDIKKTFMEWCISPFECAETAKRLSMHRNSLQYRLKKIRSLTGKDPWCFKDAFELWAAFLLVDMKRKPKVSNQ